MRAFSKMHGAGNDFVVLDLRDGTPAPDAALCRHLADRRFGVGCDQVLTIAPPRSADAVASYRIWNSDGSVAGQCGNGARCVAAWLQREQPALGDAFVIDSPAGTHAVRRIDGQWRIAMGVPAFDPARGPLAVGAAAADPRSVVIDGQAIAFAAVSMGNPHAVVVVEDVDAAQVDRIGPLLQTCGLFPDSVNVGFAQIVAPDHLRLRVYERGAGETLACGSGACAAAAVLMRRGMLARAARVALPGGDLHVEWPDNAASILMRGPAVFVYEGRLHAP